jgi:Mrp family chromosome partitioning ATPase
VKDIAGGQRPSLFEGDNSDFITVGGMRHSIRPRRSAARMLENYQSDADEEITSRAVQAPRPVLPTGTDAWDRLSEEDPGISSQYQGNTPLVEFDRDGQTARAFDLLRTRLRKTMKENGWKNIAIASPTSGCGNTFTALNLALSMARIPQSRTVLMDLNLRAPGLAKALEMDGRGPIRDYLKGTVPLENHMVRISDTLALGLNRDVCADAPETLQDPDTLNTLEHMRAALRPDMVIYDLPPILAHDDVAAFLPQVDGVMIVSDGTQTTAKHLRECEQALEGQVPLLGVILNRARASSIQQYS